MKFIHSVNSSYSVFRIVPINRVREMEATAVLKVTGLVSEEDR